MCPVFQKFFFLFHKVLLKVGDVAVSKCNYNFAKFHQYLMAMAQHISWRECSKTLEYTYDFCLDLPNGKIDCFHFSRHVVQQSTLSAGGVL